MTELVIDGEQLFLLRLDALLDAYVVRAVQLPRTCMTLHISIARLFEHRSFPERLRERLKAERCVERLGLSGDFDLIVLLRFQRGGHIEIVDSFIWFDQRIDFA